MLLLLLLLLLLSVPKLMINLVFCGINILDISRQKLERLVPNLEFSHLSTYVEYVKDKRTSKVRKNKMPRCESTLELIDTDICKPFTLLTLNGYRYFIIFMMISLILDM